MWKKMGTCCMVYSYCSAEARNVVGCSQITDSVINFYSDISCFHWCAVHLHRILPLLRFEDAGRDFPNKVLVALDARGNRKELNNTLFIRNGKTLWQMLLIQSCLMPSRNHTSFIMQYCHYYCCNALWHWKLGDATNAVFKQTNGTDQKETPCMRSVHNAWIIEKMGIAFQVSHVSQVWRCSLWPTAGKMVHNYWNVGSFHSSRTVDVPSILLPRANGEAKLFLSFWKTSHSGKWTPIMSVQVYSGYNPRAAARRSLRFIRQSYSTRRFTITESCAWLQFIILFFIQRHQHLNLGNLPA